MKATTWLSILALAAPAVVAAPAPAEEPRPSAGAYIRSVGSLKAGDAVPPFRAKDIYGAEVCLEDMIRAGKKPVLAFWSVYCQACVEKFVAMVAVQQRFGDRGLAVISVNTDGEYQKGEREIRDFIAAYERKLKFKINFPVLYDERNWLPQALKIEFLPTIVTVGPDSRIAGFYQKFDESSPEQILAGIESLARDLLALYPAGAPQKPEGPACPPGKK